MKLLKFIRLKMLNKYLDVAANKVKAEENEKKEDEIE